MSKTQPAVIALFPEASFGAALNCVGIAQELKRLGTKPVFFTHPGFDGVFSEYGFDEYGIAVANESSLEETQNYWQGFLNRHLPHFKLSPQQQIDSYVAPVWEAIVESTIDVETGLEALIEEIKPALIVIDNVIMFPAIERASCPWVRVISCAETELSDAFIPPYLSGISSDDVDAFDAFHRHYLQALDPIHRRYNDFRESRGLAALPAGEFLETSPWLNLILAPQIIRRRREKTLDQDRFKFLEACVRHEGPFEVPVLPNNSGPLVYVSFGSLGAMDTRLFQRMISVFADFPARFLLNVGGLIDCYTEVPDNVYLEEWYPQPSVVEQCDLFIHHGGNNSFCEALYYGIPSLIMPYCWDGHDNATRAQECKVGRHMNRDDWSKEQFTGLIGDMLKDKQMRSRLRSNSEFMRRQPGPIAAAEHILTLL